MRGVVHRLSLLVRMTAMTQELKILHVGFLPRRDRNDVMKEGLFGSHDAAATSTVPTIRLEDNLSYPFRRLCSIVSVATVERGNRHGLRVESYAAFPIQSQDTSAVIALRTSPGPML